MIIILTLFIICFVLGIFSLFFALKEGDLMITIGVSAALTLCVFGIYLSLKSIIENE